MKLEHGILAAWIIFVEVACGSGSRAEAPPAPAPVLAVCGDGKLDTGEECDDGNTNNADGCYSTCQKPVTWVASDPHIHSSGCGVRASPRDVEGHLRSQEIQVGATLVWGDNYNQEAHYFTGRDHPVSAPGFIQHYDLEVSHFPAARPGHLLLLGLDSLNFSDDPHARPRSGVPVIAWARRQPRAVVGMAHGEFWPAGNRFPEPPGGCCMPWEYAAHVARGQIDFLGMERTPAEGPVDGGTFQLWRTALNSGFRLAITGASDWPCITRSFNDRTPRTDVIVEGELTYESWLLALKGGRTAAATGYGERLNVRVDGARIGSEVHLAQAREVTVTVETVEPFPTNVELLVNGLPSAHVHVEGGIQLAQAKLTISRSSWISARSPHVQTSAIYVLVGDQPIRASAEDTCYLLRAVDHVDALVTSRRLDLRESQAEARQAYAEARAELQKRFREAGGQTCP